MENTYPLWKIQLPSSYGLEKVEGWEVFTLIFSYSLWKVKAYTAQKREFSIKDFFSKCDQIRMRLRIWSHLLKNP